MRITDAWSNIVTQNNTLRLLIICLTFSTLILTIAAVRLAFKDPIIIDRNFSHSILQKAPAEHSVSETKLVIEEGLKQRFNSKRIEKFHFLNPEQRAARDKEQKQLTNQKLDQIISVLSINISKDGVMVDAIRTIKAGLIPSSFLFNLKVEVEGVTRTFENPYGLRISDVTEVKKEVQNVN